MTSFFEVINVSATHIYHSALELSPLPSIVRTLYYHQHSNLSPRLVTGTPDPWDESIAIFSKDYSYGSHTWSQCGQFVAAQKQSAVEVRDPLTLELLFTLKPTKPIHMLTGPLAYSPDGHSLACLSNTTIIIWDIQTHEVVREIKSNSFGPGSLVWSSDGKTISTLLKDQETHIWAIHIYDVASGTPPTPGTLQPTDIFHLWAHNNSFRVATMVWGCGDYTIDIFDLEVGSPPNKVESFYVQPQIEYPQAKSFSPATHHISISFYGRLFILDVQDSKLLLEKGAFFESHQFSPDGSIFAASLQMKDIHIWKYTSSCYIPFKRVSCRESHYFQFSPTFSLIMGNFGKLLQVW